MSTQRSDDAQDSKSTRVYDRSRTTKERADFHETSLKNFNNLFRHSNRPLRITGGFPLNLEASDLELKPSKTIAARQTKTDLYAPQTSSLKLLSSTRVRDLGSAYATLTTPLIQRLPTSTSSIASERSLSSALKACGLRVVPRPPRGPFLLLYNFP